MALYKYKKVKNTDTTTDKKYKYEKVSLKRGEAKKFIMKMNKWDERTYEKQYDLLRNKVRTLERFETSHGVDVKKQSTLDILYKEAKAKEREGDDYTPSLAMQRLRGMASRTSGESGAYKRATKVESTYASYTLKQFSGLIDKIPQAKEIAEQIKDPVKLEKALSDFANKRHDIIEDEKGERSVKNDGAKYSETTGSPDVIVDFDISKYL